MRYYKDVLSYLCEIISQKEICDYQDILEALSTLVGISPSLSTPVCLSHARLCAKTCKPKRQFYVCRIIGRIDQETDNC